MKLRNKKTGGIWDIPKMRHPTMQEDDISFFAYGKDEGCLFSYHSLAELNAEWEDYKEPEPLIKDAGMREVLRLWAKVNLIPSNATTIEYQLAETLTGTETEFWDNNLHIMFYGNIAPNAVHGKIYTIAELCGEEEE